MAYRSDRGIEWIDRVTKRMTQTPDGADRLLRWLVVGFGLLALSISFLGLGVAIAGSDHGVILPSGGVIFGMMIKLGFQRNIHFGPGADERTRLIAWKSRYIGCAIVVCALFVWMIANSLGARPLWVPESPEQWFTLALTSWATALLSSIITAAIMEPPYFYEPDEEMEF